MSYFHVYCQLHIPVLVSESYCLHTIKKVYHQTEGKDTGIDSSVRTVSTGQIKQLVIKSYNQSKYLCLTNLDKLLLISLSHLHCVSNRKV